ncbi:LysR family transcriptional regulator [Sphingobium nicotianae]|uniref:LysR family transcriptional regulator n=1 Tax=Sphingobium nicotianae TaxID=2782607 RepID=A0A9X1IQI1_9SPHN|nr:LysR family transcriptional regulator [Sphingobium nicotianae]MBT2186540.1 LysR family transcriptional regulator [Sphingobium nicotianae]
MSRDSASGVPEDVTFAQLRVFACAARAGSFAQAAEQLDIAQPSVSEVIRVMEERLGRLLFQRRKGARSELTEEGEEVLELVESMLSTFDKLYKRSRNPPGKFKLRISIGPYLREAYLKPLVPRICREFPDVELEVHPMLWAAEAVHMTESGAMDLAIYEPSAKNDVSSPSHRICEFPLALFGPPGTRARLAAGDCSLNEFQYLFPLRREFGARWAKGRLRAISITPRVAPLFVEFADVLAQMIEDGQGIGYLMPHSVADRIADGRLEKLDTVIAPMRRLIARSTQAPVAAQAIEDMLYQALAESIRRDNSIAAERARVGDIMLAN